MPTGRRGRGGGGQGNGPRFLAVVTVLLLL